MDIWGAEGHPSDSHTAGPGEGMGQEFSFSHKLRSWDLGGLFRSPWGRWFGGEVISIEVHLFRGGAQSAGDCGAGQDVGLQATGTPSAEEAGPGPPGSQTHPSNPRPQDASNILGPGQPGGTGPRGSQAPRLAKAGPSEAQQIPGKSSEDT